MASRNTEFFQHSDQAAQEADDHWSEHGDHPAMDDGVSYEEPVPTAPDGWSFIPMSDLNVTNFQTLVKERTDKWRPEMKWFRITDTMDGRDGWPQGIYIEVWKNRPAQEAPFSPQVTGEAQ